MNERIETLIGDNVACLCQGLDLLAKLSNSLYVSSPDRLGPHRVGGHLRHCLEFYECFFDGLRNGLIDYDSRRRDPDVESSRDSGIIRLLETIDRLSAATLQDRDALVLVRVEGEPDSAPTLSSAGRELGFLLSHTIHHFALIAITLQGLGVDVDPDFGVSPSTLRYRAEAAACAR